MILDANTTAFLFPGQGSQKVGMGKELAAAYPEAKQIFDEADATLGIPLSALAWDGPEAELNDTVNTQPALFVHSLAALRVLQAQQPGFVPAYVAGHSLGELSAAVAAGALDYAAGVQLVRRRGELMKEAGTLAPGGMAAILGLDIPALDTICAEASTADETVQVANDNCPGQVVISGHAAAVERAMLAAKAAGAKRALPLPVSIAAHSALMATAQAGFNAAVAAANLGDPQTPLIGNVSAAPLADAAALRADLEAQLTSRVRWTETIQALRAAGVNTFVELGTGNVLTGLLKRIDPDAVGITLGTPEDFEKLAAS
ncbi:MAG: ACP S-malonyltransferase [Anaerolineales bacterium]|nr:ACP S-malonyltransferase [Anaerolineales bacterium]